MRRRNDRKINKAILCCDCEDASTACAKSGLEDAAGCTGWRSRGVLGTQSILTALSKVFHTPQASGMPTKAQNSAALASSPPNPMPYEPDGPEFPALAVAACSLATSASLMC